MFYSKNIVKDKFLQKRKQNPIQEVQQLGQAIWIDYIRHDLLKSGELQRLIELGISGLTSNPTILEKAIVKGTDYDDELLTLARDNKSVAETYETLVIKDIRAVADLLYPLYYRTGGADGYVSLEVNPLLAYDMDGTVEEAKRLFAVLNRPNVMIKVPATPEGISAIRYLISENININATLIFSLETYQQVMQAYIAGLEDRAQIGKEVNRIASVASFFLSRIDTAVDALLEELIQRKQKQPKALLGKTAIASAKLAYKAFANTFNRERFAVLKAKGARAQRPLWASTSTKNPAYSDVMYVEPLIGSDTVNTMPPVTITAFLEHGRAQATLEQNLPEAEETLTDLAAVGISIESVTAKLLIDGIKAFIDSYKKLLAGIEEKKAQLIG